MLQRGPSPLERARARVALAGMLTQEQQQDAARDQLRQALDEADRAGATALAAEAREALLAAGARPRRARLSAATP